MSVPAYGVPFSGGPLFFVLFHRFSVAPTSSSAYTQENSFFFISFTPFHFSFTPIYYTVFCLLLSYIFTVTFASGYLNYGRPTTQAIFIFVHTLIGNFQN